MLKNDRSVSHHILTTAATMVGVCITVISIVRLTELSLSITSIIDNIMSLDSLLFLLSCVLSYLSLRASSRYAGGLERWANVLFLVGLVIMVAASFMLAWELRAHDAAQTHAKLTAIQAIVGGRRTAA